MEMNEGMRGAFEKACAAAEAFEGFVKEHPVEVGVFVTVLAIGVVGVLAPECLAWLGFEEVGILEGLWFSFFCFSFIFPFPVPCFFSFVGVCEFLLYVTGLRIQANVGV